MIDESFAEKYAVRKQTKPINIIREYFQLLFLSYFYEEKESGDFFFKGGTALKIVFHSPRYSEDIDFTTRAETRVFENIFQETFLKVEKEGIKCNIVEAKKTAFGHLAIAEITASKKMSFRLKIEASQREKPNLCGEEKFVESDLFPKFRLQIMATSLLIKEKQTALLDRHKPRDLFDLWFILRSDDLRRHFPLDTPTIKKIEEMVQGQDEKFLARELKTFLPQNFHFVIKDLKSSLLSELKRI